ncbi:MAG TPA: BatA domain-containing protein, partial [Brevundimonas sp.]
MTPGLLLPAGLAALAALIVPLVIHIARRSEQQPTDFAALRWLRQKPRPRSRLRFDEWPLLLLRLLLLALVAFWLARPALFGASDDAPYIAVIPGADLSQADAVIGEGRAHWLAPGSPDLDQPRPAATAPVASLIRQLDADLP